MVKSKPNQVVYVVFLRTDDPVNPTIHEDIEAIYASKEEANRYCSRMNLSLALFPTESYHYKKFPVL